MTIRFFHIDEGHIALIFFAYFVHKFEDSRSSCQGHDHHVELHGNLANRVDKASGQGQEGNDGSYG